MFLFWADIRKPWDFSRCYWQGQRSTVPFHHHLGSQHSVSLCCTATVPATCASHPPHLAPPFTLIPAGKQTEGGRTHNFENELEGETLSPNPFTASDHKSQLQIELRSEIILSSSSCRDRSSGLCFPGNKKEHHNSLLASK